MNQDGRNCRSRFFLNNYTCWRMMTRLSACVGSILFFKFYLQGNNRLFSYKKSMALGLVIIQHEKCFYVTFKWCGFTDQPVIGILGI